MMRILSIVALVLALSARASVAICPPAQSIGTVFGCPGATQACVIGTNVDIDDGCTLDFGNRPVTLQSRMRTIGPAGIGAGTMTIRARSFTIAQSGLIQGVETDPQGTQGFGGMVTIVTAEDFVVQGALQGGVGMIDVTGGREGGVIDIDAGRDVFVSGRLKADGAGGSDLASGGSVEIRGRRNVRIDGFGRISVTGENDGAGGGDIDISAGGNLEVFSRLLATGADGGAVDSSAGSLARITDIESVGEGDAGCGGCLNIQANSVEISGWVRSDGTTGTFESGGSGGFICVGANFGNLTLTGTGKITADGAKPDGAGGEIALEGQGDAMIAGQITATGPAGETCGGGICLDIQGSVVRHLDGFDRRERRRFGRRRFSERREGSQREGTGARRGYRPGRLWRGGRLLRRAAEPGNAPDHRYDRRGRQPTVQHRARLRRSRDGRFRRLRHHPRRQRRNSRRCTRRRRRHHHGPAFDHDQRFDQRRRDRGQRRRNGPVPPPDGDTPHPRGRSRHRSGRELHRLADVHARGPAKPAVRARLPRLWQRRQGISGNLRRRSRHADELRRLFTRLPREELRRRAGVHRGLLRCAARMQQRAADVPVLRADADRHPDRSHSNQLAHAVGDPDG